MSKSENAFRTITEAATLLNLPPHVLRFWESKFKNIKPMKRGGGRRYYRPEDLNLLRGIKYLLHTEGLTIKRTQKIIQTKGVKNVAKIGLENKEKNIGLETDKGYMKIKKQITPLLWPPSFNSQQIEQLKRIDGNALRMLMSGFEKVQGSMRNRLEKSQMLEQ